MLRVVTDSPEVCVGEEVECVEDVKHFSFLVNIGINIWEDGQ